MNMECSKYSEMQVCPQLRFKQNKHEMYITVKISFKSKDCSVLNDLAQGRS